MKNAFPNYSDYMPIGAVYDLGKWMAAMKDIYTKVHTGVERNASVKDVTLGWSEVEKRNFLDWLKYYESGDHRKYKAAQAYYVNDDINYFLPNPPNSKPQVPNPLRMLNNQLPSAAVENIPPQAPQKPPAEIAQEEKRKLVEDQRKKILGRLNSAEKLLSSHHGQIFAGPDFERLLSAIYELKKQIQTVNKITVSAQTCIDLIVRQANILKRQGHLEASNFMIKLAQQPDNTNQAGNAEGQGPNTPGDFSVNLGEIPAGGSQPQAGGSLGNNDLPLQDLAQPPTELKDGIDGFLENMEGAGLTVFDETKNDKAKAEDNEDDNLAKDEIEIDNDVLLDQDITNDNELVVEAQMAPAVPPPQEAIPQEPQPEQPQTDAPKEESAPEELQQDPADKARNDFDSLIDSVFANLTVSDIIKKLEDINKIFRNREISRQLAIVDVMLDRLGLAPYFPTLAEATNKQLEANQYCLTRVEDILSKLRGTMETSELDLKNERPPVNNNGMQTKDVLEQADQKDKQKKEMRKQLEEQEMFEKAKPELEVENAPEELTEQPAQLEKPVAPAPAVAPTR